MDSINALSPWDMFFTEKNHPGECVLNISQGVKAVVLSFLEQPWIYMLVFIISQHGRHHNYMSAEFNDSKDSKDIEQES
jgi:hypothetical protein